jgi:putative RNA 2'-phosphotransferase
MKLTNEEIQTSKTISYFLRHAPNELGIELDSDGWTNLSEFLILLNKKNSINVEPKDIEYYLENSEKKRFEIDIKNDKIRAKYGHSVNIKINYEELTSPIDLYHGTSKTNLEDIKQYGILKMSRQFVHISSDYNLAVLTAKRHSKDIIIFKLNTTEFMKKFKILNAGNGIYLVDHIDFKYLTIIN